MEKQSLIHELAVKIEHVPPKAIKKLLNGFLWEGTPDSGMMSLTFDDGPDPDITLNADVFYH